MGTIETSAANDLRTIVEPFAQMLNGPGRLLPGETCLAGLRDYYSAADHADFHHPEGYVPYKQDVNEASYVQLPFALALGLHPAGHQLNPAAAAQTFDTYAATGLLASMGNPDIARRLQRNRATSVLAGTVLNAAINPRRLFTRQSLDEALEFSRDEGFVSRSQASLLRRTVSLVTHI